MEEDTNGSSLVKAPDVHLALRQNILIGLALTARDHAQSAARRVFINDPNTRYHINCISVLGFIILITIGILHIIYIHLGLSFLESRPANHG